MKKIAILTVFIVLAFLSCDNFYNNSLGSSREYDWKQINLTTSNIEDWVRATVGNPPLARAVTDALLDKLLNENISPQEMAIYLKFAAKLAIEASNLGAAILINATELLGGIGSDNAGDFSDMLDNLQDDFNAKGGRRAAELLANLLGKSIDDQSGTPRFDPAYGDKVTASEVSEAMIVLLLGEMASDDDLNINDPSNLATMGLILVAGDPREVRVIEDRDPSPNAVAIAAYLNLIASDKTGKFESNPFTYAISTILISGDGEEKGEEDED